MKELETYKDGLENGCLKHDYPFLFEAGESEGEDISGGNGYDIFLSSLSGMAEGDNDEAKALLKEFEESFNNDGWITKFVDKFGDHFFWGKGMTGDILVIHAGKNTNY